MLPLRPSRAVAVPLEPPKSTLSQSDWVRGALSSGSVLHICDISWPRHNQNKFASALSLRNVNLLTVTLVASVTLAVLDTVASALVLRILNFCFPLSYFDFAQLRCCRTTCAPADLYVNSATQRAENRSMLIFPPGMRNCSQDIGAASASGCRFAI